MSKEKVISICAGIGLNMFFPEYVDVVLPSNDDTVEVIVEPTKKIKKRKNKKDE